MTTSEGEGNFRGECYPLGLCHGLQDVKALIQFGRHQTIPGRSCTVQERRRFCHFVNLGRGWIMTLGS